MLVLPRTSAVVAFFSSCLWASVWERALLQPTRAGAFLLGSGGPTLLLPRHQVAASVARHASRSHQRQSSARRGGSEPMMCLRMAPSQPHPTKVAFQGESGAYSEKSLRELLGTEVVAVAQESFEDAFKAVARREVEYAVIPIENSLGGSIHANYDLLLRYELYVIGEHDFRVEHCLLALPGTKREDVKKVMSHPQALAQCDNYLRGMDVEKVAMYDTAGSAKLIAEGKMEGCAAIASDLAAEAYGMEVLASNIEDDDMNFTRFLLLARTPVGGFLSPGVAAKTSIVFTLPNSAGALYKALACFSLREIDFSKIESRPTSAQLLQYLRFQQTTEAGGVGAGGALSSDHTNGEERRFQYCFYLVRGRVIFHRRGIRGLLWTSLLRQEMFLFVSL
ncbi:unnamed protein product [Ectocarpus sp. 4 AP-2014]